MTADGSATSAWKNTPDFKIDWTNPTDDSGIKGVWYRLGSVDTFTTAKPFTATVSSQGLTQMYVWLEDNSSKQGSTTNTVRINLRYDASPPQNPATCTAWENSATSSATSIANNTWQNIDANPYLEWVAASDTPTPADDSDHCGVDYYSIYWGTSVSGEPNTGTVQTNANYTITEAIPTDSTYYLRVRTTDFRNCLYVLHCP